MSRVLRPPQLPIEQTYDAERPSERRNRSGWHDAPGNLRPDNPTGAKPTGRASIRPRPIHSSWGEWEPRAYDAIMSARQEFVPPRSMSFARSFAATHGLSEPWT
jgi:hypothetical protein